MKKAIKGANWDEVVDKLVTRYEKRPKDQNKKERTIAAYGKKKIKEAGGLAWKIRGKSTRGVADYLIALNGLHVWEAKRPKGGVYSTFQKIFKKQVEARGGKWFGASTNEEVDAMVKLIELL